MALFLNNFSKIDSTLLLLNNAHFLPKCLLTLLIVIIIAILLIYEQGRANELRGHSLQCKTDEKDCTCTTKYNRASHLGYQNNRFICHRSVDVCKRGNSSILIKQPSRMDTVYSGVDERREKRAKPSKKANMTGRRNANESNHGIPLIRTGKSLLFMKYGTS